MTTELGKLYVVATPIGNLADISFRAVETLKQVDLIAAEDTRHIKMLLHTYQINNKVMSLHEHNEEKAALIVLEKLAQGDSIALVSDAGTPLVSDPGMPLVKQAKEKGFSVVPIPGACALIAALSVSGMAMSRFSFEGFSPRTSSARKTFFAERAELAYTWVFYESSHRILASLYDLAEIVSPSREIVIAREMTKIHETIVKTTVGQAIERVESDSDMTKGEFVVIVAGLERNDKDSVLTEEQSKVLAILLKECSIKTAVALAAEITGARKKSLYQQALLLQKKY